MDYNAILENMVEQGRMTLQIPEELDDNTVESIQVFLGDHLREVGKPNLAWKLHNFENGIWLWKRERGTLPKRLASHFKKTYDYKLPQRVLTMIGNIAVGQSNKIKQVFFDVIKLDGGSDELPWKDGAFGDNGSCYFQSRIKMFDIFKDYGFYALRTFLDECGKGIGRCWLYPTENGIICFNGYNRIESNLTVKFARILSQKLDFCTYKRIDLSNNENNDELFYINDGSGWIVSGEEEEPLPSSYDFDIDESYYDWNVHTCDRCENRCSDTFSVLTQWGHQSWCGDCRRSYSRYCPSCGDIVSRENAEFVQVYEVSCHERAGHLSHSAIEQICPSCADNVDGYTYCSYTKLCISVNESVIIDDTVYSKAAAEHLGLLEPEFE